MGSGNIMKRREFTFELRELKHNPQQGHSHLAHLLHVTTGVVRTDGDTIEVFVDDVNQPNSMFEVRDSFFKRIIERIHKATKGENKRIEELKQQQFKILAELEKEMDINRVPRDDDFKEFKKRVFENIEYMDKIK